MRWFDSELSTLPRPVDWRYAALITATLFLNIHFWIYYGDEFWMLRPILPYGLIVAAVAVLTTALFFAAPAVIAQATNLPLHYAVERSVGSLPAFGLRICVAAYLLIWMASLVSVPATFWLDSILRREVSRTESGIIAGAILAVALFTGLQSTKTAAKLALFGNKLGIAILLAAIVRVREGLPVVMNGFSHTDTLVSFWQALSSLIFYVAPLIFLAGSLGHVVRERKQLAMIAGMGIALPLFATVTVICVINVATFHSSFYQPSLSPNVPMALWGRTASSSLPGRMLIVAITTFGPLRFGVRSLAEALVSTVPAGVPWIRLSGLALVIAWFSVHQDKDYLATALEAFAACLICTAAVLSADCLTQAWRTQRIQRTNWVGLIALLVGLACIPCWKAITGADTSSHTWLLPSYAAAFLVCLLGRYFQRKVGQTLAI